MNFRELALKATFLIELQPQADERGFFARTWSQREFAERGLNPRLTQCALTYSMRKGTVRGLHYQAAPHQEAKLVRCTRGAIYDVIVDLRPGSRTCGRWEAVTLSAQNRLALYVPEGFAHGLQTLEDNTEVFYQMSECRYPESERGLLWSDPALAIAWPIKEAILSERDRSHPLLEFPCG